MWDKAVLIIVIAVLAYFLKNYSKVFNWITFNLYFSIFYISNTLIMIIWPFPILNGRTVKNAKLWARILKHATKLYGIQWELRNGEVLAKDRGAVIVANHQSTLDVTGMYHIWETADKVTAIVKKELFYVWPMGLAAYLGGAVFIDRKNPKNAYAQLKVTADVMTKEKTKIWVFPEGTRNFDYTKFLPFKKGAFTMAVAAQTPIIPLVFSPYYFIDRKNYTISKARVIVKCLDEVPTTGLTMEDVPELIERVRNMMLAAYKELSDEVLPTLKSKSAD
ncbi:1-acyl-sn-glycerol-3-phosphate acyltransferase alpha-like [Epargyreus clarus]|uniref:1-acyl-sn-glycerol-3-phosphate acyltransferase alpha-like n=1 Tax=Epargyreus clarus TaxID=520877 RepID=UPI003C3077CF